MGWPRTAKDHHGTDGSEGDGNVRRETEKAVEEIILNGRERATVGFGDSGLTRCWAVGGG